MKIKYFISFIGLLCLISCKKTPVAVYKIAAKEITVSDSLTSNAEINDFIAPYKAHLDAVLDSPLAYSPGNLSKNEGELNTAIGNLMADIVFEQTHPVFKARTGKEIDFVLLNYGGIRSGISEGNITTRTVYEVMPFENKIVIVELSTEKMDALLQYLARSKWPHPISSQLNITLNRNNEIQRVTLHGQPLGKNRTYYVATSDYLMNLGDNMDFFADPVSVTETDYLIRNAMIDYFKKTDTVRPVTDKRFIKSD